MSLLQPPAPWDHEALAAESYWADKEWKKYAVDVSAGPERRPTYRSTFYAHCRTADGAIAAVKNNGIGLPSRARFAVRLAGPRELGCVPAICVPATNGGSACEL